MGPPSELLRRRLPDYHLPLGGQPFSVPVQVRVQVQVIGIQGQSTLVEWLDGTMPMRGYVPRAKVGDDLTVPQNLLDKAIPYGVDWTKAKMTVDPQALCQRLRDAGIWTHDDLARNPRGAIGALQATYRVDLAALLRLEE